LNGAVPRRNCAAFYLNLQKAAIAADEVRTTGKLIIDIMYRTSGSRSFAGEGQGYYIIDLSRLFYSLRKA